MSTDSQGRPLSDDGQWAWTGSEWVPAAYGGAFPETPQTGATEDARETMIAPSPFAGGGPAAGGYGGTPQTPLGEAPGYGAGYGGTPGYGTAGAAPGYAGGVGAPPPQKSRTPLIAGIVGAVVVIAAIVVILIVTLGSSSKKGPNGAFTCTVVGQSGSGVLTFVSGKTYTITQATGGAYSRDGDKVTFKTGDLKNTTGTFNSGAKTFNFTFQGNNYTCKQ